ncbi:DUF3558 family protein [Saccharothrix syringae]|uniref:DUF3558 domain-containing protein n=1 Tax=Saccharothrix syringae TaxID=103733 RepID=A0A5Q0GU90_SACSY|nr:DUF3558 family protein [Saccharothrix syringae]QFZ17637.1 DUF3558 domain-containing protein [Saccharothrix syringae]
MNRALTRLPIALALLAAAACSGNGASGTPTPAPNSGGTTTSTTGSTVGGGDALADLKPCDLLTSGEVTRLGLSNPGEADRVGGAEACRWNVSGNGGLLAAVNPTQGFADLNYEGEKTSPTKAGDRDAILVEAHAGAQNICHVVIEVSDSSSVQVIANLTASSTDTAAACKRATDAAELIAPKLP